MSRILGLAVLDLRAVLRYEFFVFLLSKIRIRTTCSRVTQEEIAYRTTLKLGSRLLRMYNAWTCEDSDWYLINVKLTIKSILDSRPPLLW